MTTITEEIDHCTRASGATIIAFQKHTPLALDPMRLAGMGPPRVMTSSACDAEIESLFGPSQ
jgi:hypothetical protein